MNGFKQLMGDIWLVWRLVRNGVPLGSFWGLLSLLSLSVAWKREWSVEKRVECALINFGDDVKSSVNMLHGRTAIQGNLGGKNALTGNL